MSGIVLELKTEEVKESTVEVVLTAMGLLELLLLRENHFHRYTFALFNNLQGMN